jgi:DNA ligase D-like protein (predicted ligase)
LTTQSAPGGCPRTVNGRRLFLNAMRCCERQRVARNSVEIDPAGFWPLAATYDLDSHPLARLKLAYTNSSKRADVNEHVLWLAGNGDEAKPAGKARGAVLYAFDLLAVDGKDLRKEPLVKRKEALARLLKRARRDGALVLSEEIEGPAEVILRHACRAGLEGIVSKRRDSTYSTGRSKDWLKTKCVDADEFVIIGYTPSETKKGGLGALRVATKYRGKLHYAGGVGTGFSADVGQALLRRLEKLRVDKPAVPSLREPGTVWVSPELIAEIEYRGWTEDKLLRHPSFKGLREDK